MYAAVVYHRTQPGLLAGDTTALDRASDAWIDFPAGQPGFVEFMSMANEPDNRVVAVSLWQSEDHFRRAVVAPGSQDARAGFAGLFTELTPEFMPVRAYRRA